MDIDIDGYFGEALKQRRREKRVTQGNLAIIAGLDRTYISMLERGVRKPSLEAVIALATALKIDPVELVQEVVDKTFVVE